MALTKPIELIELNCSSCFHLRARLRKDRARATLAIQYKRAKVAAFLTEKLAEDAGLGQIHFLPNTFGKLQGTRLEMFSGEEKFSPTELAGLPDDDALKIFKEKPIQKAIKSYDKVLSHCNSCFKSRNDESAAEYRGKFLKSAKEKLE
ncbi:MAG: hypothetical protein ABH829_02720 [archaeon]